MWYNGSMEELVIISFQINYPVSRFWTLKSLLFSSFAAYLKENLTPLLSGQSKRPGETWFLVGLSIFLIIILFGLCLIGYLTLTKWQTNQNRRSANQRHIFEREIRSGRGLRNFGYKSEVETTVSWQVTKNTYSKHLQTTVKFDCNRTVTSIIPNYYSSDLFHLPLSRTKWSQVALFLCTVAVPETPLAQNRPWSNRARPNDLPFWNRLPQSPGLGLSMYKVPSLICRCLRSSLFQGLW